MILARTTSTRAVRTRRIALIVPRVTTVELTEWMLPMAHVMKVEVISFMFYLRLMTLQIDELLLTSSTINYYRIFLSPWTVGPNAIPMSRRT